jgi:hypothetical protein
MRTAGDSTRTRLERESLSLTCVPYILVVKLIDTIILKTLVTLLISKDWLVIETAGRLKNVRTRTFPPSLPAALGNDDIGYVEYQWKV